MPFRHSEKSVRHNGGAPCEWERRRCFFVGRTVKRLVQDRPEIRYYKIRFRTYVHIFGGAGMLCRPRHFGNLIAEVWLWRSRTGFESWWQSSAASEGGFSMGIGRNGRRQMLPGLPHFAIFAFPNCTGSRLGGEDTASRCLIGDKERVIPSETWLSFPSSGTTITPGIYFCIHGELAHTQKSLKSERPF